MINHKHPLYMTWLTMRQRCRNPKAKGFRNYGGRGITVCDRWDDFETFVEDMGEKPPGTTLDRIDNDGNYEPSNCRWATAKEQLKNKRPKRLTFQKPRVDYSMRYISKNGRSFTLRVHLGLGRIYKKRSMDIELLKDLRDLVEVEREMFKLLSIGYV